MPQRTNYVHGNYLHETGRYQHVPHGNMVLSMLVYCTDRTLRNAGLDGLPHVGPHVCLPQSSQCFLGHHMTHFLLSPVYDCLLKLWREDYTWVFRRRSGGCPDTIQDILYNNVPTVLHLRLASQVREILLL